MNRKELRDELMRIRMAIALTKDIKEKEILSKQAEQIHKDLSKATLEEIQNKGGRGK